MLFVLRPKLALLLIECISLSLNASITNQLARLFTAMKYSACLVAQYLQYGMIFLPSQRSREFSITGQLFFYYLKQERSVKKSNNKYDSNASVKFIFVVFAF